MQRQINLHFRIGYKSDLAFKYNVLHVFNWTKAVHNLCSILMHAQYCTVLCLKTHSIIPLLMNNDDMVLNFNKQ